ncbi:MAG: hypothetical protein ABIO82_01245 [Ginsengibacter sp.]
MQKLFKVVIFTLFVFSGACGRQEQKLVPREITPEPEIVYFPVTDFIMGQLSELDKAPVTPLRLDINGNHVDSTWLKREDIRRLAQPFLHPLFDSLSMAAFFDGKSFLDQTLNAYTFSYDARENKPDSIKLKHLDVYIDPQKNSVSRIYMLKEDRVDSTPVTMQLTWKTGKWFNVRSITQLPGKEPIVKEEIVKWDFSE